MSGLDRSTQQGELRSSAMSGGTDRREDEQVPQFYGRIDEKLAEWETDVRLWQVEFKVEDRDRLGPRLYRRGLHGQPKIIVMSQNAPSGLGLRFLKGALLGLESSHHSAVDHPVWSLSPYRVGNF